MRRTSAAYMTVFALFLVLANAVGSARAASIEEAVCGSFKEWLAFTLLVSAAGKPNPEATNGLGNVQEISHATTDGRTLRGFKVAAQPPARGALLFAQGNATLADQMLRALVPIASQGIDVYVFDYRGYGLSNGTPRLKAIISDYTELAQAISKQSPGKRYLYGVSFGGIVLLNALASVGTIDALVIDSSPSVVSDIGCPTAYDPVTNVPSDAQSILMIVGDKDRVVPPLRSSALAGTVSSRGGRVEKNERFAHPFMDEDLGLHMARMRLITDFLLSK